MATLEETVTALDTETTRIGDNVNQVAAELAELREDVAERDQATADRLAPIVARLTGEADRLAVLGSDPEQPVPPLEPAPEPAPES
ncbi:MAG: hypothetical protein ACRDTG_28605 [Pseudonocardiaceae bacterium]